MTGPWVDFRSRTCMDVLCQSPQNPVRVEPIWNPLSNLRPAAGIKNTSKSLILL